MVGDRADAMLEVMDEGIDEASRELFVTLTINHFK